MASQDAALSLGHDFIGTEHLLLGLAATAGTASEVLRQHGVELSRARDETARQLGAQVIDGLSGASLDGQTEPVAGPGWPAPGSSYLLRQCLLIIPNEEWEHRLYAERDLDALEAGSA